MPETAEIEFDLLRRRADACGHYVNRHREYDPARGGGDLYLQEKRKFRSDHVATLIRYATVAEIEAALADIEASR